MKTLLKHINKRYFENNPVRFKMKFEGQGLTNDNLYLLGGRAGPPDAISIQNLLHEMCHLAEREKDKLIEKPSSGWGFSLGKFWSINVQPLPKHPAPRPLHPLIRPFVGPPPHPGEVIHRGRNHLQLHWLNHLNLIPTVHTVLHSQSVPSQSHPFGED